MAALSEDLHARGVRRLMVEGGKSIHTQFLAGGLADELQLVVAPFFVGDSRAPRLTGDGAFPWSAGRPATAGAGRAHRRRRAVALCPVAAVQRRSTIPLTGLPMTPDPLAAMAFFTDARAAYGGVFREPYLTGARSLVPCGAGR